RARGARTDPCRRRAARHACAAAHREGAGVGCPARLRHGRGCVRQEAVFTGRSLSPRAGAARRRSRRAVAVAEAAHGLDRSHIGLVGLELAAEIADVELDLVAADAVCIAPDEIEQLLAAQHLARVAYECGEKPELERRQLHLAVADRDTRL